MAAISISKNEYDKLTRQAEAYRKMTSRFFEWIIRDPIEEVVTDFRDTDLYSEEFLTDLESGLHKSSYRRAKK